MDQSNTSGGAGRIEQLKAKLKDLSQEEFRDFEGLPADYSTAVRTAFNNFSAELGLIMKGGKIDDLSEPTLNHFTEKLDELRFLLSKI